jgi:hypothetical protein
MKMNVGTSRNAFGVSGIAKFAAILATLAFSAGHSPVSAQSQENPASANSRVAVPPRITQAIDENQLRRLPGNVHPLANAKFNQGAVSDGQPMDRMLLLLKRRAAPTARGSTNAEFAPPPRLAHARTIWRAIRPVRRRYSGHHRLAEPKRLSLHQSKRRSHHHRVLRQRRSGSRRFPHRN